MRLRVTFSKTEAMRYTGHLDLYRTLERMLRRSGLPLAYSQGFKPHPRIVLASALPLGYTSQCEVVDIWLEQDLPLPYIQEALHKAAPPGLQVLAVTEVDSRAPALPAQVVASEYLVKFLSPLPGIESRLAELWNSSSLPRKRREKNYDLRPLIQEIELLPCDQADTPCLRLVLLAREGATGRPEEVVLALGGTPEKTRIHRTRLIFQ